MFYLTQTSFGYKFKQLRCGLEIERSLYLKEKLFFFSLSAISVGSKTTPKTLRPFLRYIFCVPQKKEGQTGLEQHFFG